MSSAVPEARLRAANDRPVRRRGAYVLYLMTAQRRRRANFALQHAADLARGLQRPLLVLEALRCGHRWAADRHHAFVLQGMADNARDFTAANVTYHPYVEPTPGAGRGLVAALAARACVVVGDESPAFFLPRMNATVAARIDVRFELVDGNGLLPMRVADRCFARAFDFRRFLQRALPAHLAVFPLVDPLRRRLPDAAAMPAAVSRRWPAATPALLAVDPAALRTLPIDHAVGPVARRGGVKAAAAQLRRFLGHGLPRYGERSDPDAAAGSGLSPYLHFGHVGAHQVFGAVARRERWQPGRMRGVADGQRGWFGMSEPADAFLEQLVTWRELGLNFALHRPDHDRYDSLPEWARATLAQHSGDPREHLYAHDQLEAAATHDEVWNAAQRQLRAEGTIHNYLRMLWGKKVLEWSPTPEAAWRTLVELNNRWCVDGRDPNSYTGIGWVFGRFDRPWAPVRPVFGCVRYMSSASTRRKLELRDYLARFSE